MLFMDARTRRKRAMWVMKPGALKYFRELAGLSLKELKRASKTALSTIARLQAEPGAIVRGDTLHRLAKALGRDATELADLMTASAPTPPGQIPALATALMAPSIEIEQSQALVKIAETPGLAPVLGSPRLSAAHKTKLPPALGTLSRGAAWERAHGVARSTVETVHGPVPQLGFDKFKEAFSAPKEFHGQRFVVVGVPDEFSGSSSGAARALHSDPGICMRFRMVRTVCNASMDCQICFYGTVYTGSTAHAAILREAMHAATTLALLTRLTYGHRAFQLFETPAGRPRDLAFLVEDVLPVSSDMIAKPAQPKARRNIRQKSRQDAESLPSERMGK